MKTITDLEAAMMLIDILYGRGLINRATWEAAKEKAESMKKQNAA